jgi:hypothetical protein
MAAIDILIYLPNSYKTRDEQEYINFLWESYESNYNNGKYPFAFIAFHMLYMSFVYFEVWQIKMNRRLDFEKSLIAFSKDNEKMMLDATTPFAFVEIGESNFIRFLKLIGCDNAKIGSYCTSVKARNDAAHSNGRIFFNDVNIVDRKVDEILRFVDEIQTHSQPIINESLVTFLQESHDPDNREYIDDTDQIREILIHSNYLSQKDIEHLLTFDITQLNADPNYAAMQQLFETLTAEYAVAINTLRTRAHAPLVTPAQIDLDFILDERSRELFSEEERRYTLVRTGKLVERVKLHNVISGPVITDRDKLLPIPQNVIDANLSKVFPQNPGY